MGILIVGTGALGCLFAARLASTGVKVTMLGSWAEGLSALRKSGVRLLDMEGHTRNYPVEVIERTTGRVIYTQVMVLVKSWQTQRSADQLTVSVSDDGVALTLQNGLGNYETLVHALGAERVALGVTTCGARMLEPGYVQHTGVGKVTLGEHPRLEGLSTLLQKAGFQVEVVSDLRSLLWGKLVINAAINPLTALLRVENGELLRRPAAHGLMLEIANESAKVAEAIGIRLPYPDARAKAEEVARKTASNTSSMLQDVLRGASTEIDAINGAIVRAGEASAVPTPTNHMMWRLVKSLEQD